MKKIILTITIILSLIVVATAIGLSNVDSSISLEKGDVTTLKDKFNVDNLTTNVEDLGTENEFCDNRTYCFRLNIDGVINNKIFKVERYYRECPNGDCGEWIEYNNTELVEMRDAYVKERLEDLADTIRNRDTNNGTYKDIGGEIGVS